MKLDVISILHHKPGQELPHSVPVLQHLQQQVLIYRAERTDDIWKQELMTATGVRYMPMETLSIYVKLFNAPPIKFPAFFNSLGMFSLIKADITN